MEQYLRIESVTKEFRDSGRVATPLRNVDLGVDRGEVVSFVGESGTGKSTLLALVAGLTAPTSGRVLLGGRPVDRPGAERAMVFQGESVLPWLSVRDNVFQAVEAVHGEMMPLERKLETVEYYLRVFGLWRHRHRKPGVMDEVMRLRIPLARALAVRPRVLLLDDPLGSLAPRLRDAARDEVITILAGERARKAQTVLMVTSDIDEAISMSDRIVVLRGGPQNSIHEVFDVPPERPRERREQARDPCCAELRERIEDLILPAEPSLRGRGCTVLA
jgi:nitrate/nitrite transport system ATP-binding protein